MPQHRLDRHGRAAAAQNQGLFAPAVRAHPAKKLVEAPGVGVLAHQPPVSQAHQSVHAAQLPGQGRQQVAKEHHGLFIGNRHVEALKIGRPDEFFQFLRLLLIEPVFVIAKHGMDGRGVAVAQLPAQKSAVHQNTSGVLNEERRIEVSPSGMN